MTAKQREEIENFIKSDINVMTIQQARAIAQAILENNNMLKELTRSEQPETPIQPLKLHTPIKMDSPKEIAKKIRKSMQEITRHRS